MRVTDLPPDWVNAGRSVSVVKGWKITSEAAEDIREAHYAGVMSLALAREYGVTTRTIRRIVHGKPEL